ncbi:MAG: ketopantoate reductase family protein [Polyangiales bacterium]
MKIAVFGVGALGSVYALRLSHVAPVTMVVRSLDRAPGAIHAVKLAGANAHGDARASLPASTTIPEDADVVLVAVRVDQLEGELLAKLAAAGGPSDRIVVVLAPLLPPRLKVLREALGDRLVVAMPGVISYEPEPHQTERRVRYWTPQASPTVLEDRAEGDPRRAKIHALCEAMRAAQLPCHLSRTIASVNAATTIAFFPMLTGIAAAGGSIDRMLEDRKLLDLGLEATKETRALAKGLGELPSWASLFFGFMSPWTVRAGIKLGRSRAPEAFTYLEKHFGTKLAGQNAAMFREIEALAAERGVKIDAVRKLAQKAHAA